jgi:competence protein ComEC
LAVDPLLAPEVMTRWQRFWRWGARGLTAGLVTSLAAWLGSLPLSAYYFHLFSPVTLLANLIVVPLSSLTLACNLGSLICGDWLPWFTDLFNHAGWFLMLVMVKLSRWATELPGAYYYVPSPSAFTFLVYYGLLIGTMCGWLWKREQRWRTIAGIFLISMFYGWQSFNARKNVELTILPLSGGHAEYLDARGKTLDWLVDCGNTNSFEFVIKPFLRAKGVNQLPRLMLTHGDLKHIGGTELLSEEFQCYDVFASSFRFRSPAYRRLLANLKQEPYRLQTVNRGDAAIPWQLLHPATMDHFPQGDDGALVRSGEFHGVKILLLSDLGRNGQNVLLDRTNNLRADIVVSGIPTQTDPLCEALLDAVRPRVIIVADSDMPAPARANEKLNERLARRNVKLLHTRETGAVTILFHANGCEIRTATQQHFNLKDLPEMNQPATEIEVDQPSF